MNRSQLITGVIACVLLCTSVAEAVKTATWTHEQPKDFVSGKLDNLVVTSQGELMLGRARKTLHEAGEQADVINALVQAGDGKLYAATGPGGIIYKIDGEKVSTFATLPEGGSALSLLFAQDGLLLAGTGGGEQAKIYAIDGAGKVRLFHEPKDARYIWAMARGPAGEIYAATGIEGQLFVITPDGNEGKVLADLKPKNLLCLAFGSDGMLYTGTDDDGLVYRVNPETSKGYVMYDAAEDEISAIVIDEKGNIYASTATADQAKPGRAIADKPGGKPDRKPADTNESEQDSAATQPSGEKPAAPKRMAVVAINPLAKGGSSAATRSAASSAAGGPGNAIYRIDTDGFVTEIFRQPVMILSMAQANGTIYASTGNEGRIYAIAPAEDKTTMLVKLEPEQATTLLRLGDGSLVIGTANAASLVQVASRYAEEGTLISEPLDAGQIVKWGRLTWEASIPTGATLTLATRSSNVKDKESESWEEWSGEMNATTAQQIASAGARFLQYRLTFKTAAPDATPVFRKITMARVEENRPPEIKGLTVLSAQEAAKKPGSPPKVKQLAGAAGFDPDSDVPAPQLHWVVDWTAADPNEDAMLSEVFYRQVGRTRWIRLAKDLSETLAIWDTRTVPDGKYEVRVVTSDRAANSPGTELSDARISDPITVDNTPPDVKIGRIDPVGKDGLTVSASAVDAASPLLQAGYSVDSSDKWISLAPDDDIFDSPSEQLTFTIDDLDPGEHVIALRVTDEQGNTRFVSQSATVSD